MRRIGTVQLENKTKKLINQTNARITCTAQHLIKKYCGAKFRFDLIGLSYEHYPCFQHCLHNKCYPHALNTFYYNVSPPLCNYENVCFILFCSMADIRFLLQSLEDLDLNLRKLGSRLFVLRGQPVDVLPKFFKEWGD